MEPGVDLLDQAALLRDRGCLNIPRLMDVAVLYGPSNPEPTRKFLEQVRD